MILNKLDNNQLKRLNNQKEQKVYDFIVCSRRNEMRDKYIYDLKLANDEEVIAQFDTEIELEKQIDGVKEKYCEISFVVLKVLKKNKGSKLRKNKTLYFDYSNIFESFELLEEDDEFTETLLPHQILKYDFEESTNIQTFLIKENNTIKMRLFFHPYMQKERFKLSPKADVEILITFFYVDNAQGIKNNDQTDWDIHKLYINDNKICFKICSDDEDWTPEDEMDEISFNFKKAELRVVKDKYIGYYKGKYMK